MYKYKLSYILFIVYINIKLNKHDMMLLYNVHI